jgi:two-component system, chemotaxis family, sensor kinase Cph1
VRDNGIGIAKKHTETVFEPFKRLNPTHRHEGQGIGLTSCKKIVERLGGKIWIVSDLDEGTTVYFSLPAISETNASK